MIKWQSTYRHYNHLMDFTFWVLLVAYARGLLGLAGVPDTYLLDLWAPLNLALGIFFILSQILLIALILMRRLRDEYAEQLWQKSAASFVKLLPVFPMPSLITVRITELEAKSNEDLRSYRINLLLQFEK